MSCSTCLYKVHKRSGGGVIYTEGLTVFLSSFLLKNKWLPVLSPPTFILKKVDK